MNNNTRIRIRLPLAALILGMLLGGCGQHPESADSPTGGAATPMAGHPGAPPSATQAGNAQSPASSAPTAPTRQSGTRMGGGQGGGPAAMGGTPGGANGKR